MNRWAKFRALSSREKLLLLRLALLMPWIGVSLRIIGFRRTQELLARRMPAAPIRDDIRPAAWGNLVNGAGLILGAGSCLRRALMLWWLLRRRGFSPDIRLGVREAGTGSLAHAWVELDGEVLNDTPDVAARCVVFEHARVIRPHSALAP